MGAPEHNVPFQMPMIREFVPAKAGPWIYLVIAVTFQLSGGVYAGTMEGMRGATAFMREDIMMGLYANLAGMVAWLMYHLAWSSMNYLVAGMMVIDLLFLICCTRHTRAVPKFPLYGIDWLGAVLWSAFLLQTAYFFCYGQFHDWFDSPVMKTLVVTASVTQWHVLAGSVAGCLFSWWWMHWKRLSYLKLLIVGTGTPACHMISYYFLISHDIHISALYAPSVLRGFSYAILSATFMVCLEEIMSFRHFFQALSIFNMLHMVVGGVVGSALYSRGLSYFIADNTARYGAAADNVAVSADPAGYAAACGQFMSDITEISIKQLYGMAAYAAVLLCLLFLLYDSPVRRHLKLMPAWRSVRDEIASTFGRHARSIH